MRPLVRRMFVMLYELPEMGFEESLTPKFRGACLARPKRTVVEASPATPS